MLKKKGDEILTRKEAKEIIKQYRPHKGFFDLSAQPKGLNDVQYAKILKTQNFLAEMNKNKNYLIKFEPIEWGKLKELSGQLQNIIYEFWGSGVL